MSFGFFSPAVFLIGLAALAALLFALQRLRVRHRVEPVVTTLFWREALEEAKARVFVRRFRHWLAYLLILALGAALWLAAATPERSLDDRPRYVVLIDTSAAATTAARRAQWVEALETLEAKLPPERTTVLSCGATTSSLLAPGEPWRVASRRLETAESVATPASFDRTLRDMLPALATSPPTTVILVGDAPISTTTRARLPKDCTLERVTLPPPLGTNRGIVTLGLGPARSGDWDRVDALVEVDHYPDASFDPSEATVTLDGTVLTVTEIERSGSRTSFRFRNLPAAGGTLEATLTNDAFPIDDEARLVLPRRPVVRVAISDELATGFAPLVDADPAFERVTEAPQLWIATAAEPTGTLPTLRVVPATDQDEAILIDHDPEDDSERTLRAALGELGLDQIDAHDLSRALDTPIAVGARPAPVRSVQIWQELLGSDLNFTQSQAFPLFVGSSLRWLADFEPMTRCLAVNEAGPTDGPRAQEFDREEPLPRPRLPGAVTDADGNIQYASFLDPETTRRVARGLRGAETSDAPTDRPLPLATWIGLAALLLLSVEWYLQRTGRIP